MKIFISHSSTDKWAAKRISQDLVEIGVETFLDEKDIRTGESINQKIQDNLVECNDLLILISPASIESQWVLIELGGALALKKNIIPIFLYVGANEIPKPISKLLGRDINDIERYYDEIKAKLTGKTPPKTKKSRVEKSSEFQIGDRVQLPLSSQPSEIAPGWNEKMDKYLGIESKIEKIELASDETTIGARVKIDNQEFLWALSWLTKF